MKYLVRKLIVCFWLGFLFSPAGYSADQGTSAARQLVDKFERQLIDVMKNGQKLGFKGRFDQLKPAVEESHDLPKIARIVVGKEWEKLSTNQQDKLVNTFSKLSIASYAHNFKEYSGEAFTFDNEEQTARGGVVIHSHLTIPDDKPVKFDYMLKESGSGWKIINIIANGVSDLALKRSEYTTILEREGFDALISKINDKIESYEKQ